MGVVTGTDCVEVDGTGAGDFIGGPGVFDCRPEAAETCSAFGSFSSDPMAGAPSVTVSEGSSWIADGSVCGCRLAIAAAMSTGHTDVWTWAGA
jgi:hypothetical protein